MTEGKISNSGFSTDLDAKMLVSKQRKYFDSHATKSYDFRITQLKKLRNVIAENEQKILNALHQDLRKSDFEGYATEVGFILGEIDHTIKHLKGWMSNDRVSTPLFHAVGSSKIIYDPYGVTFIIAPWNYPFQLCVGPLIGAIAAGNTAVVKPSEISVNTGNVVAELLNGIYADEYVSVVLGGIAETKALLQERFDYLFFTGSTEVGRLIYQEAAKHLTPVTLELGGKSPCIIDKDVHLDYAVKRIVWGKFTNAGQTCVAPDYLLVHEDVKDRVVAKMKSVIADLYGNDPQKSPDFGRIINEKHFNRLEKLLDSGTAVLGGDTDISDLYISPTLLDGVSFDDPVMHQEIFGPILPIISVSSIDEAINIINKREKPLALYLFSTNKQSQNKVMTLTSSGGGCINDTLMHLGNAHLPFGGVGASGMGAYHGKFSFETFSHSKAILSKSNLIDVPIRYAPYKGNLGKLKTLMKYLN